MKDEQSGLRYCDRDLPNKLDENSTNKIITVEG
jgi:hypothetical protein